MKKAVIEVRLVDEAQTESNETIEREMRKESIIAWCKEIEKVTITESQPMGGVKEIKEALKQHHYSDKAITEILKLYVNNSQASNEKAAHGSWMNVIECVLEKTIGSSKKVHVMGQCNLTNAKFQVYFNFLQGIGFIREVEQSIEITEKGLIFLKEYRRLKASLVASSEKR